MATLTSDTGIILEVRYGVYSRKEMQNEREKWVEERIEYLVRLLWGEAGILNESIFPDQLLKKPYLSFKSYFPCTLFKAINKCLCLDKPNNWIAGNTLALDFLPQHIKDEQKQELQEGDDRFLIEVFLDSSLFNNLTNCRRFYEGAKVALGTTRDSLKRFSEQLQQEYIGFKKDNNAVETPLVDAIKTLRICPDYGCYLWTDGLGTNIDSLDVPFDLSDKIDTWGDKYDEYADSDKVFDWDAYKKEGRVLAMELKKIVGDKIEFYYYDEIIK